MSEETCISCGAVIPEGRQVCPICAPNSPVVVNFATSEEPDLPDSGDREHFETGAVRDIQTSKGRRDLLPLDIIGEHLHLRGIEFIRQLIFDDIESFKNTGNCKHLYNVMDDFCAIRYSGDCTEMYLNLALHFEAGAAKYGDNNWQKGIPTRYYIASATGHYLKWLRGDTDEPHDRAFVWNLICCIWTCIHKPELNDYGKKEKP